ncbi:MAG TPA: hypothetical protein VD790_05845 [Thermoleophilaceae bacterium]|nr:hypothetical protein [Thermoleophilaceae bacterium]
MKKLNLNADFLLDIWADLKAKKLAPVAIGLALLVVAVPALMLKGEEAPGEAPLPILAQPASNGAEVELAEELAEGGSDLDSYKARDPFDGLVKPEKEAVKPGTAYLPGEKDAGDEPAPDTGGDTGLPSLGDDGSDAPDLGGPTDPGKGGGDGNGTPNLGAPDSPNDGDDPPVVIRRPPRQFTYQLDLKFGRPGREQHYPNLTRMSFLPSRQVPALMFMGVTADEKAALFFVHPTLSHQGEGACIPKNDACTYLQIRPGQDHFFSVDDYEFRIRLLDIQRVKLSAERKQRAAAREATRQSARGVENGESAEEPLIQWPLLADGAG